MSVEFAEGSSESGWRPKIRNSRSCAVRDFGRVAAERYEASLPARSARKAARLRALRREGFLVNHKRLFIERNVSSSAGGAGVSEP